MQNSITHLGLMMKDGSKFHIALKKCIYQYDVEDEFETTWYNLLNEYDIKDNAWLQRIYGLKSQWAKCYMKNSFTIGIQSTQLSESLNSDLKDYLKSTLDVVQFFKHFERVLNQKRGNELKAEFNARNKMPRLANSMSIVQKQVGELYTPVIFQLFQEEYNWINVCTIIGQTDGMPFLNFRLGIFEANYEYKVCCNPLQGIVACSCMKFEANGILCCHCLKVFDVLDIKRIPEHYILKRWTRGARTMVVNDSRGKEVEQDVNLDCTQRYKRICPELIQIASEASNTIEGYNLVKHVANELRLKLGNIRINTIDCPNMPILPDFSDDVYNGLHLKHKEKSTRGGRRFEDGSGAMDNYANDLYLESSAKKSLSSLNSDHEMDETSLEVCTAASSSVREKSDGANHAGFEISPILSIHLSYLTSWEFLAYIEDGKPLKSMVNAKALLLLNSECPKINPF
ncbi:protein FAR1-RELATED SEQUENCE 5-like [Macadamia integrifolia]|uniref:protein FAR1-RELATED SEQUENCE 5-like n=1 Tax=Macadamia integrifolia TaxID=60698 RepID=UPI001C4EAC12|nr:protein FAR1-RELATED SEQUENCE 5-like [Macadamia integrifolia]